MHSSTRALMLVLSLAGCGREAGRSATQVRPIPDPPPSRGTVEVIGLVASCEEDTATCEIILERVTAYGAAVPQLLAGAPLSVRRLREAMTDLRAGIRIQAVLALRRRQSEDGEIRYWDALTSRQIQ